MGKKGVNSAIVCALALHCAWSDGVAMARLEWSLGSGIINWWLNCSANVEMAKEKLLDIARSPSVCDERVKLDMLK